MAAEAQNRSHGAVAPPAGSGEAPGSAHYAFNGSPFPTGKRKSSGGGRAGCSQVSGQEVSGAVVELDVDRPPAAEEGVSSAGELGSTDVEEAAEAAGGGCGAGAGGGRGVGAPEGTVAAAVERLERRSRRREATRKTSGG